MKVFDCTNGKGLLSPDMGLTQISTAGTGATCRTKMAYLLSGDQSSRTSAAFGSGSGEKGSSAPMPSAERINILFRPPLRVDEKPIRLPSGDHRGLTSGAASKVIL